MTRRVLHAASRCTKSKVEGRSRRKRDGVEESANANAYAMECSRQASGARGPLGEVKVGRGEQKDTRAVAME